MRLLCVSPRLCFFLASPQHSVSTNPNRPYLYGPSSSVSLDRGEGAPKSHEKTKTNSWLFPSVDTFRPHSNPIHFWIYWRYRVSLTGCKCVSSRGDLRSQPCFILSRISSLSDSIETKFMMSESVVSEEQMRSGDAAHQNYKVSLWFATHLNATSNVIRKLDNTGPQPYFVK